MAEKLVLAYSGGLDTSVAVRWIKERYGYDVVTLTADLGNAGDLPGMEDARDEFIPCHEIWARPAVACVLCLNHGRPPSQRGCAPGQ